MSQFDRIRDAAARELNLLAEAQNEELGQDPAAQVTTDRERVMFERERRTQRDTHREREIKLL